MNPAFPIYPETLLASNLSMPPDIWRWLHNQRGKGALILSLTPEFKGLSHDARKYYKGVIVPLFWQEFTNAGMELSDYEECDYSLRLMFGLCTTAYDIDAQGNTVKTKRPLSIAKGGGVSDKQFGEFMERAIAYFGQKFDYAIPPPDRVAVDERKQKVAGRYLE